MILNITYSDNIVIFIYEHDFSQPPFLNEILDVGVTVFPFLNQVITGVG